MRTRARAPAWAALAALLCAGTAPAKDRDKEKNRSRGKEPSSTRVPLPPAPDPVSRPPHPVVRLEVSADGALLLAVRRDAAHPYAYTLLHTGTGQVLWQAADVCCAGPPPWDVLPAPKGGAAAVLYPDPGQPQGSYRLLLPDGKPVPLPDFSGGAWAADGSWLGGSLGAFAADGRARGAAVPNAKKVPDVLFGPGPTPGTLRYVDGAQRYQWDGAHPPRPAGPWRCAAAQKQRNLDGPSVAPVRFSSDGRFVAWSARSDTRTVFVCDAEDGQEQGLPGEVLSFAFAGPAELYYVAADGSLWRRALPFGKPAAVRLPGNVKEQPRSVAVAADARSLYVGTQEGNVYRLPL